MQLILDTKGIVIRQRNGCFHLQTEKYERLIGPQKVSSIVVTAHCVLTTAAIRLAVQQHIPIYFIDGFGRVEAQLWSAAFGKLSTIRRKQVFFALDTQATAWVIELFELKLAQQTSVLVFLKNRKIAQKDQLNAALALIAEQKTRLGSYKNKPLSEVSEILMGLEGTAARAYWQAIADCMPDEFRFEDRNRHPATDAFNAAINYLYGMLYTVVETAIFGAGLDPYLGILHADQYDKPTLSYDLIEPFRPWVDRLVIEHILSGEVALDFFEKKDKAVLLGKKGKQFFIPLFNATMQEVGELRNAKTARKNHIHRIAGELVEQLEAFEILDMRREI